MPYVILYLLASFPIAWKQQTKYDHKLTLNFKRVSNILIRIKYDIFAKIHFDETRLVKVFFYRFLLTKAKDAWKAKVFYLAF